MVKSSDSLSTLTPEDTMLSKSDSTLRSPPDVEDEAMLGSRPNRPESLTISVPKQRLDYTLVEDMFSKLTADDDMVRAQVVRDIARDVIEMAQTELHSVKLFLSTILRLAHRSPFPDISSGMSELLLQLEGLGLQIPRVRFRKGPSFYIPDDEVPKLDDMNSEVYQIFKEAFMNDSRVSHMVQVMGFHPKYLVLWVQTHHYLLRGAGQLPKHWRAYIAIMASSRHHCLYTVNLLEREFLMFGGNPEWLGGLKFAPKKMQNLVRVNNLLCHQPWLLTPQLITELSRGPDSWSRPELTQALTIACHFHALSTFVLGCGLTHEIDSNAGHTYVNSPLETNEVDKQLSPTDDKGNPVLFDDIYSRLIEEESKESRLQTQDVNHQHFTDLIEQQSNSDLYQIRKSSALAHYIVSPEMTYEVCTNLFKDGHEFDWEQEGYPCCRNYNVELADMLDKKFKVIQHLTYKTMGKKENIDTSKLRSAVWYFVHQLYGIYYMDFDYEIIKRKLPDRFRDYIRAAVCVPEKLHEDNFTNWETTRGFTYPEKVHFCLIMMEARFQASYCYALWALN